MNKVSDDDIINLIDEKGDSYQVLYNDIKTSKTITDLVSDLGSDQPIPIPAIHGKILEKVIEYCKTSKHDDWVSKFAAMTKVEVFSFIKASNYLDMPELLDLTTNTIVNHIKGKTPEQLREYFEITRDATKDEEDEMLAEWEIK
jgi:S-phase kinase-associated protein 1